MVNINKSCNNCKHYFSHYIKKESRLVRTACGSCAVLRKANYLNCDFWEDNHQATTKNENIKSVLKHISSRLDELALIINDD